MVTITKTREVTAEEFLHLAAIGAFPEDRRFELLDGEIVEMPPSGPEHDGTSSQVNRSLVRRLPDEGLVRPGGSLPAGTRFVPLPDFTVVRYRPDLYRGTHPNVDDVLLVIEVSDSSLAIDRSAKAKWFAQAGIQDYWLVDVQHQQILVMRQPSDEGYQLVQTVSRGQTFRPLSFPDIEYTADEILGPPYSADD